MQRNLQRFPALLSSLICVVILPAVLCVGPALAQEKPEAPKPKHGRTVFIVGTALLAASKTADAITTRRVLDLPGGYENNPTFGRHPSPLKQAAINLGFFAAESGVFYLTERNVMLGCVGRAAPSSATQLLSTRAWPPVIRASIRGIRKFRNACPWFPICEERGAPLFSQRTRP